MDRKRKLSFFDDGDNQKRKIPKTENIDIGKYSIGQRFRCFVTKFLFLG